MMRLDDFVGLSAVTTITEGAMGEGTSISWTDHTFNLWRGCTKVGPGCDACYAEARDIRYEGGTHWGVGAPRILASPHTRNTPFRIAAKIAKGVIPSHKNKVFVLSLGDFLDNEVDEMWRADLWAIIRRTPTLRYQLVTKRIGNAMKMLPADFEENFKHCGIIATAVNQEEVDRDLPKLIELKVMRRVSWVGLSIEPQIGRVLLPGENVGLDWAITGGESRQGTHGAGAQPRPYDPRWATDLIEASPRNGTAIFVKQTGACPVGLPRPVDGAGGDPKAWPAWLRVQEFPQALR